MWQFAKAVEGIGAACRALDVPITGGNVSLYNETDGQAIYPTPTIGIVGLLEHADRVVGRRFQESGDAIVLLGDGSGEVGGSEYLKVIHHLVRGVPPALDLDAERALQALLVTLADDRLIRSAHDCSDGGLAVTLAECCFDTVGIGAEVSLEGIEVSREPHINVAAALFGESASRVVVSVVPEHVTAVLRHAAGGRGPGARHRPDRWQPPANGGGRRDRGGSIRRRSGTRVVNGDRSVLHEACGLNTMFDKFKDECGVFGIFGHPEAANMTYLGLYALQHRGQESAGIAASDLHQVRISREMGYVADIFDGETLANLPGPVAIGHVRYSTAGESKLLNAQPILIDCAHGQIALCHNGNIVNARELRDDLVQQGSIFQSNSDTEVILHLYARSKARSVEDAIVESVAQVQGAFSLVMLTKDG